MNSRSVSSIAQNQDFAKAASLAGSQDSRVSDAYELGGFVGFLGTRSLMRHAGPSPGSRRMRAVQDAMCRLTLDVQAFQEVRRLSLALDSSGNYKHKDPSHSEVKQP